MVNLLTWQAKRAENQIAANNYNCSFLILIPKIVISENSQNSNINCNFTFQYYYLIAAFAIQLPI